MISLEPQQLRSTDASFTLLRASGGREHKSVLIVAPAVERPSTAHLGRLQRAYWLRHHIDPAWGTRPISLVEHEGKPALLLEDPGGVVLETLLGQLAPLDFLRVAIAIASSVSLLHASGLIHRDLRPSNVLVDVVEARAWLTGLCLASRGGAADDSTELSELSGTLPYLAPERTGRRPEPADVRSDLYALGVTLYELATGQLPFLATEPIDWLHSHVAQPPIHPAERGSQLPDAVNGMLLKLLEKQPRDRYQSAAGLVHDLRKALAMLETHGSVTWFLLGSRDLPEQALSRPGFRGRAEQLLALGAAFARVRATGEPSWMLVRGYSGIGKSSLVREFLRTQGVAGALVARGKFDEVEGDGPYATFRHVIRELTHHLLAESSSDLASYGTQLSQALGPNVALLTRLVPELELIVGTQPELGALPPEAARNRAFATFSSFFRIFSARRPLLLFLDDLQWFDDATLALLEHVFLDGELRNVLLIGAYRDNEVTDAHPLRETLRVLASAGRDVRELDLPALAAEEIADFVAEALHTSAPRAQALAEVIQTKTGGNPFFISQFLSALAEDALLTFDHHARAWVWDLQAILARGYTENLAELVRLRLARLPEGTLSAVTTLACLGGSAQTQLLASLLQLSSQELLERLGHALSAGVLTRSRDALAFPHDRLQEAAYALLTEAERGAMHLTVGRALLAQLDDTAADALFEAVRHLNRAAYLLTEQAERTRLSELNLILARRAKASAADATALSHLVGAWSLLPVEPWSTLPELAFEITLARAESEFLVGDRDLAHALLSELAQRTSDLAKLGAVVCAQLALLITRGEMERAVELGVDYLRRASVPWVDGSANEIQNQYDRLLRALPGEGVTGILSLPRMSSPLVQAILDVCATVVSPAYFVDRELYTLLILHMAVLSLEHGNAEASSLAYALLCVVLGPHFDNDALGLELGLLSEKLLDAGLTRFSARAYLPLGVIIVPRTSSVQAGLPFIEKAFDAAQKSGDLVYAVYTRAFCVANLLACGAPLERAEAEAAAGVVFAEKRQFPLLTAWIGVQLALIRSLRGVAVSPELWREAEHAVEPELAPLATAPMRFYFWVRKLQAHYFAGDLQAARDAEQRARALAWCSQMFPEEVELWFYGALTRLWSARVDGSRDGTEVVAAYEHKLAGWAARCPATFANKAALVLAERLRLEGRELEAEQHYELASQLAREHGLVHEEALAHELSAGFYEQRGLRSVANAKWSSARSCYLKWGALHKVQQLDRRVEAAGVPVGELPSHTVSGAVEQLELAAVVSALRAVSSSLELGTLLDGLMRSVLQHAAAESACLVLCAKELRVRAEAFTQGGTIRVDLVDRSIEGSLPESVLRFVLRSSQHVLVEHGSIPAAFSEDPYLRVRSVRSLLCLPIVVHARVLGVLYLENNLYDRAFRPRDLEVLQLIAAQAAVSIENARLFAGIHEAQQRVTQAERVSRTGSFSWRPTQRQFDWSEEMFRLFEMDHYSLELIRERTHPEDRALFDAMLTDAAMLDGRTLEYRLLLPNGTIRHLSVIASRISGPPDVVYAGTVRDVTDSKRAEEALQRTQAALTDMTRVASLGEMAAAIAHEVNQPLAAIGLNASSCLRWLDGKQLNVAEAREAAQRITRDANRAGAVVQRLRALFSKSEGLKVPVDLADAVAEVLALVRSRVRATGALLRVELPSDLPLVRGDRVQLQQVLMNLVINALESMSDQTEPRELLVSASCEAGERVRCEIRDNGPGVPQALTERVFEAFYSTKAHGMGIGLSIARTILESHGARLLLRESSELRGATFSFELPCASP